MRLRETVFCQLIISVASFAFVMPAHALEWADLWSSAEQRAERNLEKQQYDELIESAPDANWRGLGEYRKGEYTAAAKSFAEQRQMSEDAGFSDEALQAMYNQANAHVHEENYTQALSLFDEILEQEPQHDNALHNRDITQQLLEQQQQEQQGGESQESSDEPSEGEESDQQNSEDSGEGQDSEQQSSEQSDSQNQEGQQQNSESDQNQQADNASSNNESDEQVSQSAQDQAEQDAAAAAAMQAEQQRQAQAEPSDVDENAGAESIAPAPLTEREQANEQWLRQIPDDPAGLLERKLQNRHLTDFPTVRDSNEPW